MLNCVLSNTILTKGEGQNNKFFFQKSRDILNNSTKILYRQEIKIGVWGRTGTFMKKAKKEVLAAERLEEEFDHFVKLTIKNIVNDVLRTYVSQMDRNRTVNIDDYEDMAAPEATPEVEKISVVLGSSSVLFENEKLAAGIQQLSDKHRQILECAFVLDMPNKAIGELMELEAKTIRNYRCEAYGILRRYMEDAGDEQEK
jgi:DNA-directed RNA polymerase specialized sigma24 family protein